MSGFLHACGAPLRLLAHGLIRGYQHVSGLFPQRCRFYPTCSAYADEAIRVHGFVRGTGLALWRLLRCSPLTPGGVDHVPPVRDRRHSHTPRYDSVIPVKGSSLR